MKKDFLKFIQIGDGYLKTVDDAKFFLSRSFTPKQLLELYKMTDEVLFYVLAQVAIKDKIRFN